MTVEEREVGLDQEQRTGLHRLAVTVEAYDVGAWFLAEPDEDTCGCPFCEF